MEQGHKTKIDVMTANSSDDWKGVVWMYLITVGGKM
jgi:hypothetical protein